MKKLVKIYNAIEESICGIGILVGLGIILYNVFCRYVLKDPHAVTDELNLIILSVAIILGFSVNVGEENNIEMDLLYSGVKKNRVAKCIFDIFNKLCMLVYSAFITYYGYQAVIMQKKINRTFPLSKIHFWKVYTIIVFVGVLMFIRTAVQLTKYILNLKKSENKEE